MIHGVWLIYAIAVLQVARRAVQDWRDPDEDRRTTLIVAGIFAAILAGVAVVIVVLT